MAITKILFGLGVMLALAPLPFPNASAAGKDDGMQNSLEQMLAADIVIRLNRMDPVAFSHSRHLADTRKSQNAVGFTCGDCHPALFERVSKGPLGMEVPHETGGCAECHNGKKRSDGKPAAFAATTRCLTCHKPPA